MTVANVQWADETQTRVSLMTDEVVAGEVIPMVVSATYDTDVGRGLFDRAVAGEFGSIAPYIAPTIVVAVPQVVSRFQARAALLQAGLLADVETMMTDPTTDPFIVLAWKEVIEFRRNSPIVVALMPKLGLTDAQVDDLFCFAATIQA